MTLTWRWRDPTRSQPLMCMLHDDGRDTGIRIWPHSSRGAFTYNWCFGAMGHKGSVGAKLASVREAAEEGWRKSDPESRARIIESVADIQKGDKK